jgi:hypothetical protein
MSAQEFLDIGKNLVSACEHVIIPAMDAAAQRGSSESKHTIAARTEVGCADFVVASSIRMLAAIDFDYQSAFD